ncbi:TPM domain-containing protein [Tenacibaculum ovolyticum]|uniref:TPM domain-containing protein n=1 Tax=Tenacibaculum ovolyticum TaxID=104270 RepID=UPI001F3E0D9C|nr:TPM domain-containing protein [Tenacibaculum ovolyticum]
MIQRLLVINKKVLLFIIAFAFIQTLFSQGFEIPKKPNEETSVYDYVGLLSKGQKINLENKLIKYSDTTSTQIVIAIIDSTKGENINYLGANWLSNWGIGQAEEDNGVLIILAKDDRKLAISTGYGVEHLLTDFLSKRIIEREIIPGFKRGDYYAGLNSGADAIFKALNGEYKGSRKKSEDFDPSFIIFIIILIIFFVLIFRGNKGNRGGGKRNYRRSDSRSILETIILSNAGRGGFGNGGFGGGFGGSSGGFGSGGFGGGFGGGMGGGGGASGSW